MEKKTIAKLSVSAVLAAAGILCAFGVGRGGNTAYQLPGPYTAESTNDFSTVQVAMTIQDEQITDCEITSSGDNDLLNDEIRAEWAQSIVDNQSAENDVISGATLTFSANSVKEAAADIFAQAGLPVPEPAEVPEAEETEAAPADEESAPAETETAEGGLTDGTYTAESVNDFSTVSVEATVEGGKITAATVSSSGDSDLLTDDLRAQWGEAIVESQSAENDAISGATLAFSAASVKEAVDDILAQAGSGDAGAAEASEGGLTDGTYTAESANDFSTVSVEATVEGGKITAAIVSSSGDSDLLTDDLRAQWGEAIVESQSADNDAISGATLTFSAASVKEAVDDILAQAGSGDAGEAEDESDARIAELEAALAEAEARADEAEAKVAELEAAAEEASAEATESEAEAADADISAYTRPRPAADSVTAEDETVAEAASADISAYTRPRPAADGVTAEDETVAESADADISAYTRPRPAADGEATEDETVAEAADADISAYTRPRPAIESEATESVVKSEAEAADADISAYTRPRPATESEVAEDVADEAADTAEALTEEQRLASVLPYIVTTMGDNRENSYVVDYLEQDPYLVNIYEGYGFAKDYGSARGHEYTLEDVAKTQRPHPKANCITCKTPDLHKMIEEQGVAVYSMPFDEVYPLMTQNVGCYTCHGDDMGNGGALKVTHQYVNEALGENVSTIAPATLSCGQCHIEYYFTPEDSETMMPYHSVEEMTPQAILDYYDALGFSDWTQESTGTAMLKAQHPEMETVLQGKHAAFLTCADCHMPPETTGDGVAYRSHTLVSPLENEALLQSCAQCHGDTDMVEFVHGIQENVTARETEVGNKLSEMKDALADAVASGQWSEDDLNAVRKLHREAQWFFDYCYVENSEGAHNSELSLSCLDTSEAKIDEAMKLLEGQTT